MDTTEILNFLYERGYQVSAKKAQISLIQVKYLGFIITEGKRMLDPQRKSLILNTPCPQTRKQLLGITGVCQIWIPIYGNLARPLYEKLKGKEGPLDWDKTCKVAFNTLKEAVTIAPALSLLNLEKPFRLYVSERVGTALGMLGQMVGPVLQPVALETTRRGGQRLARLPLGSSSRRSYG